MSRLVKIIANQNTKNQLMCTSDLEMTNKGSNKLGIVPIHIFIFCVSHLYVKVLSRTILMRQIIRKPQEGCQKELGSIES